MANLIIANHKTGDVYKSIPVTELTNFLNSRQKGEVLEVAIQEAGREPIVIGDYVTLGENVENPAYSLVYDSNVNINWSAIVPPFLKVTDVYGNFVPNGKYFRMKASGNPRMYLYPETKELILEHDGKFGRAYFGVCNYNVIIQCDFMLYSCKHNFSIKVRNRHQYADIVSDAPDIKRQGGAGISYHCDSIDNALEIAHVDGDNQICEVSKSISPKLETGKWYTARYDVYDLDGKIHGVDYLNYNDGRGFIKINEHDCDAPSQFFNRAEFEQWSEFWLRLNAIEGGKLGLRNIKVWVA